MEPRRGMFVPALLAAGLLVAACGSSSPPPRAAPPGSRTAAVILPAMEAAMKTASSVHVAETLGSGSEREIIDASFKGSDVSGSFILGSLNFGFLVVSGTFYVKVSQSYLQALGLPASDCSTACGKYFQPPASSAKKYVDTLNMSLLISEWLKILKFVRSDNSDLSSVFVPATLDGQRVLQLRGSGYTFDVTAAGAPYPVLISEPGIGIVRFSEWNSVPPVTAPPVGEIISLTSPSSI
jgi:hypothetical protein